MYFLAHPRFYPLFKARLLVVLLLSTFIYVNLFVWAYLAQVALLALFHGRAAWFNATSLVLGEGAVLTALLFEAFFVDEALVDIFDAVLIDHGLADMVSETRLLRHDASNSVEMLGKPTVSSVYAPFSFRQIIEFVIYLPINLIPIVGVPVFLMLSGYRAGPFHHWRYFQLRGFSKKERLEYVKNRQLKYTWFGTVTLLLQLVPVFSMFFLLTSAAGSALWAAKMENARRAREQNVAQGPTPTPAPYRDDPA